MNTPVQSLPGDMRVPPTRTWFGRNWKWFVPVMVLTAALFSGLFVGGVLEFAHSLMSSSDAYKTAVQRAEDSPVVAEKIGRPMHIGWLAAGSIKIAGDTGSADLSIPISGPRGKGRILVSAKKKSGQWTYQTLEVDVDGQDTPIPLLNPGNGEPGPADDSV